MMEEARKMCDDYKRHNVSRKRKGYKKIVFFPEPEELLKQASRGTIGMIRKAHQNGNVMSSEEQVRYTMSLEQDSKKRIAKRKQREELFLLHAQEVSPKYIKRLVDLYFKTRKTNALDINSRYLLLLEIAQFKCKESITFLYKINACEKNISLRNLAFDLLQQMCEHPWLARNRKGRKRPSMVKPIDIKANPSELVYHIYRYQGKIHRQYDVFLSHSSYDLNQLLSLKKKLNAKGLVVYIDWVNDSVMMNRKNQNEDTWNVLKLRMDESKRMLFVMTDNSLRSVWAPKEIDYFKVQNKEIYVYQPEEISENPFESLLGCKKCMEEEQIFTILN